MNQSLSVKRSRYLIYLEIFFPSLRSLFLHAPFSEFHRNSFSVTFQQTILLLFRFFSLVYCISYRFNLFFSPPDASCLFILQLVYRFNRFTIKNISYISLLDVSKIFINISQLIGSKKNEKKHWERTSRSDSRNVHIFFGGNVISFSIKDDTVPLAFDYYTIGQLLIRWANQMMARWWWEAFENEISLEARLFLWIFCF